jgi:nicotinamide-nucleotide amidase
MTQAQIVSIGQELLRGDIGNTNAVYLTRELRKRGIAVQQIVTLPDNVKQAAEQLRRCMIEKGVVIITGGLGGTADDVTRSIVSSVLQSNVVIDERGEAYLKKWYEGRGRKFTDADSIQAAYPEGGKLLENSVGLAFGFYVLHNDRHIFSLPGVPSEMTAMFQNQVLPILEEMDLAERENRHITLNFAHISEYTLDRTVQGIVACYKDIHYGTRASDGLIRIHLESSGGLLDECASRVEREVPDNFVYRGDHNLEEALGYMLLEHKMTLSAAESCSGGLLSKLLTDIPGSSRYFLGGVVAYSNEVKHHILGVKCETLDDYGAVSEETASEMALGVMRRFSSNLALAITGIAGPAGGTESKAVGTVYIAVHGDDGYRRVERGQYMGDRDTIRKRSTNRAMSMAMIHLLGRNGDRP